MQQLGASTLAAAAHHFLTPGPCTPFHAHATPLFFANYLTIFPTSCPLFSHPPLLPPPSSPHGLLCSLPPRHQLPPPPPPHRRRGATSPRATRGGDTHASPLPLPADNNLSGAKGLLVRVLQSIAALRAQAGGAALTDDAIRQQFLRSRVGASDVEYRRLAKVLTTLAHKVAVARGLGAGPSAAPAGAPGAGGAEERSGSATTGSGAGSGSGSGGGGSRGKSPRRGKGAGRV